MTDTNKQIISLAITGASGVQYGFRLLEILLQKENTVYLMVSKAAQVVIGMETDIELPGRCKDMREFLVKKYACEKDQLHVFGEDEWTAPTASGGGLVDAMVVCPCSMGALSAIATGEIARPVPSHQSEQCGRQPFLARAGRGLAQASLLQPRVSSQPP